MATTLQRLVERIGLSDRYSRSGHALDQCPTAPLQNISSLSGYQWDSSDFLEYGGPAAIADADQDGWRISATGTAAVALEAGVQFGALQIATGGVEDNFTGLQRIGNPWQYVVGKRMWCFAKFNISDADDMEAVFGLLPPAAEAAADTTAELLALDDGIYFEKAETATEFDAHTRKNDTSTEATLCTATFADGTDRILGFSVDVAGNVHFWDGTTIDNLVEVATVNVNTATIPDDVALTPYFAAETGAALAKDITVDWFFVAQER
jgi:hypothetical protein